MKKCPSCNNTYSDETLNFCLTDGTVLVSDSDLKTDENIPRKTEQRTEILSQEQLTENYATNKTEELPNEKETIVKFSEPQTTNAQTQTVKQGVSPIFAYLTVGLLALLVLLAGIALVVWVSMSGNSSQNNEVANSSVNSDKSKSESEEGSGTFGGIKTNVSDIEKKDTENPSKKPTKPTPDKEDTNENKTPVPTPTKSESPTPTPKVSPKPESGKFFVILGSFPQSQSAKARNRLQLARSRGLNARLVNTNNYPGLRNGLVAVVMGPFSKSAARSALGRARSVSPDAYVKSGS